MKITKEDLLEKYKSLSDIDLIEIYKSGELTDVALSAIQEEISIRNLSDQRIHNIEEEKHLEEVHDFKNAEIPPLPKIWIGFVFAFAFFLGEVVYVLIYQDELIDVLLTFVGITGSIYWFFCIHRLHKILGVLTIEGHSVSPGKAVCFHFIPFFNFYWLFKWPIEFSKYINNLGNIKIINGFVIGALLLISLIINKIDASIGLTCLFGIAVFLNKKVKQQLKFRTIEG